MTTDNAIDLYAFRYRDARIGKWTRARYRATREEIVARYGEWELLGPPEVRRPAGDGFNPTRRDAGQGIAEG